MSLRDHGTVLGNFEQISITKKLRDTTSNLTWGWIFTVLQHRNERFTIVLAKSYISFLPHGKRLSFKINVRFYTCCLLIQWDKLMIIIKNQSSIWVFSGVTQIRPRVILKSFEILEFHSKLSTIPLINILYSLRRASIETFT